MQVMQYPLGFSLVTVWTCAKHVITVSLLISGKVIFLGAVVTIWSYRTERFWCALWSHLTKLHCCIIVVLPCAPIIFISSTKLADSFSLCHMFP